MALDLSAFSRAVMVRMSDFCESNERSPTLTSPPDLSVVVLENSLGLLKGASVDATSKFAVA